MNEISALMNEIPLHLLLYKDIDRRQQCMNQEASPHQTQNLLVPWSWTSQPRTVRNKFLLFVSQVHGIFVIAA